MLFSVCRCLFGIHLICFTPNSSVVPFIHFVLLPKISRKDCRFRLPLHRNQYVICTPKTLQTHSMKEKRDFLQSRIPRSKAKIKMLIVILSEPRKFSNSIGKTQNNKSTKVSVFFINCIFLRLLSQLFLVRPAKKSFSKTEKERKISLTIIFVTKWMQKSCFFPHTKCTVQRPALATSQR
jgi:hypothetical protein